MSSTPTLLPEFTMPATPVSTRDIALNPDFYLYKIDPGKAEIQFLEVTPDSYAFSAFLDNRIVLTRERLHGFSIDAIISALQDVGSPKAPMHFIFHTSFCCSSLLARSYQKPRTSMVLREPMVLRQLADMKRRMIMENTWSGQGAAFVDIALTLLAKTYHDSESVLIKPTNLANNLIPEVLLLRPEAKIILLYTDMKTFLVSNLKKTRETKEKMPVLARISARDIGYEKLVGNIEIEELDFLQTVFVFWHTQMLDFMSQLSKTDKTRIMTLDANTLLTSPEAVLAAGAEYYGLDFSSQQISEITNGPAWNTHAKDPMAPYNSNMRLQENEALETEFREDIKRVMHWSEAYLQKAPVEIPADRQLIAG